MQLIHSLFDNVKKGATLPSLAMILLGLVFIAMMNVVIKYLDGYSGSSLAVARNVSALLVLMVFLLLRGNFSIKKKHLWKIPNYHWLILRAFFVVTAQVSFFTALHHIELGTARALNYSSAIFVTIFAMILFKEKCGIWRSSALIIGLLGTFLIVSKGATIEYEKLPYYFLAILSAVAFAGTWVTLKFFPKDNDHLVLMSYAQCANCVVSALVVTLFFEWQVIVSLQDVLLMMLLGLFGTLGVLLITFAYRMVDASLLAPFQYFGLIFSLIFGWIFFAENPTDKLFPGALLIVGAGVVIAIREHILKVSRQKDSSMLV